MVVGAERADRPGETLITAQGLPVQTLLPYGREPTSIAFLSTPGTERLNSGVANSTASAACIRFRNATHSAGGVSSRSML